MPTVSTSIRIPKDLYDWLKDKAKKEHRTISNTIISILEEQKPLTEKEANEILDRFEKKVMKFADEHPEQFESITDLIK